MNSLTEETHKCLVPLLNRPLIEWQLDALRKAGIDDIIAVTGYKQEKVAPYFSSHIYNSEWASSNMAYSLLQADRILSKNEVIVCYSDLAYHFSIIRTLQTGIAPISLTFDKNWQELWYERFKNPLDDAESFEVKDQTLVEIGRKFCKIDEIQGQYMGLMKIDPNGWKLMKPWVNRMISMTELLQTLLLNNVWIEAIPIEGKWCELDTEEDKRLYERKLTGTKKWSHDFR